MANPINRQIGDYVVISRVENVAPFFVRMARANDEFPLSTHSSVTEAVRQIKVYQTADKRRARREQ